MTGKIKFLIILNFVLLAGILVSLRSSEPQTTLKTDVALFAVQDTANVDRVQINDHVFEKAGSDWQLDQQYKVQPSMMRSLLAILSRVEVKRPAPEMQLPGIREDLQQDGISVEVYSNGNPVKSYTIAHDSLATYASIPQNSEIFEVYIPGYNINIGQLLQINEQEWRDRRVLVTTWRTLQSLQMQYTGDEKNSFSIEFDSIFYRVNGIQQLDSAKLYTYIQQFQDFSVSQYLPGKNDLKSKLEQTEPFLVITLNDMVSDRNNVLELYATNEEILYGISRKTGEVVLVDRRELNRFLVAREEFRRQ